MISNILCLIFLIAFSHYLYKKKVAPPLLVTIFLAGIGFFGAATGADRIWENLNYQNTLCKIEKQTPVETPTKKEPNDLYCPDVLISYSIDNHNYEKIVKMNCVMNKNDQVANFIKFSELPCAYKNDDVTDIKFRPVMSVSIPLQITSALSLYLFVFSIYAYLAALKIRLLAIKRPDKKI